MKIHVKKKIVTKVIIIYIIIINVRSDQIFYWKQDYIYPNKTL